MRILTKIACWSGTACFLACGGVPIHTVAAPGVRWEASTYRLLAAPSLRYGPANDDAHDPMVSDAPASRILRERIAAALETRGYRRDESGADIAVAYYATVRPNADITRWSYGYPFTPDWPRWPTPPLPSETEARIVIDVLDPAHLTLWWRGEATMKLSRDVDENLSRIADLATDVVMRMPAPRAHRVLASVPRPTAIGPQP